METHRTRPNYQNEDRRPDPISYDVDDGAAVGWGEIGQGSLLLLTRAAPANNFGHRTERYAASRKPFLFNGLQCGENEGVTPPISAHRVVRSSVREGFRDCDRAVSVLAFERVALSARSPQA